MITDETCSPLRFSFYLIFINVVKTELLTFIFQSDSVRFLALIITVTFLLQSEQLFQLIVTQLVTTVYLSHLSNPTPIHCLSSILLPKFKKNQGCFIFFTRDWEKKNKKHFLSVEIRNYILININVKKSVLWFFG